MNTIHSYPFDFDSKAVQVFGEKEGVCVLRLALQDLVSNNWKPFIYRKAVFCYMMYKYISEVKIQLPIT